jgi:hypothetical protein
MRTLARQLSGGLVGLLLVGAALAASPRAAPPPSAPPPAVLSAAPNAAQQVRVAAGYGELPLSFAPNVGQTDGRVDFLARGHGYTLFLTPTEAVLSLRESSARSAPDPADPRRAASSDAPGFLPDPAASSSTEQGAASSAPTARRTALRLQLVGARATAAVGEAPLPGRANYFLGNDPARWRTDVPTYARVRYPAVYPGIDQVWYGRQGALEYDFVVAPGADARAIQMRLAGAERLEMDAAGDLLVHVAGGMMRQQRPVLYQERDGRREPVAGGYVLPGAETAALRDRPAPAAGVGRAQQAAPHRARLVLSAQHSALRRVLGRGLRRQPPAGD